MKQTVWKLVVNFSIGYAMFVLVGAVTVAAVARYGYWRGLLAAPALVLLALYAVKTVTFLIQRRRESLSSLLLQYGEMAASAARRRK